MNYVYPDSEFRKLTRSTIPQLAYWWDRTAALSVLADALGISDLVDVSATFDATTPVPGMLTPAESEA